MQRAAGAQLRAPGGWQPCGSGRGPLLFATAIAVLLLLCLAGRFSFVPGLAFRFSTKKSTTETNQGSGPVAQLSGRFWPGPADGSGTAALPQLMTWAASSARFAFTGSSSVAVLLNGSLGALPLADRLHAQAIPGFPRSMWQFDLDGKPVGTGRTVPEAPVLTWRNAGLAPGRHILTVTKLSEGRNGAAWLHSVSLSPGGRFLPPPPPPGSGRRVLFLGDSYTVGMGNVGPPKCGKPDVVQVTNSLKAYGPLVAKQLKADYQLVAFSGAGLNVYPKIWRDEWPEEMRKAAAPRMADLLHMSDALNPASSIDAASWVPQLVVMAAGTNDFHNWSLSGDHHVVPSAWAPPTLQEWADGFEALIQQIRKTYPEAAIVVMAWPLEVQLVGIKTLAETAVYLQYVAHAASRLQQSGLQRAYFLQLDGAEFDGNAFCTMHPDADAHAKVAAQLARFIRGTLAW